MPQPYLGEIRMFAGTYAPDEWELCDGRMLVIDEQTETFFFLIGTTYGGDGETTFALPDLRGRLPVHQGAGRLMGQAAGDETVGLTVNQLPVHSHPMLGSVSPASSSNPQGNVPASLSAGGTQSAYGSAPPFVNLDPSSVSPRGGSQAHTNMHPYLCVNFIIATTGIFPPRP